MGSFGRYAPQDDTVGDGVLDVPQGTQSVPIAKSISQKDLINEKMLDILLSYVVE